MTNLIHPYPLKDDWKLFRLRWLRIFIIGY